MVTKFKQVNGGVSLNFMPSASAVEMAVVSV